MMDLKKGDEVLDICSGPGGKALAIIQTLKPKRIVCNDHDHSRLRRVKHVMQSHFYSKFNEDVGHEIIQYSLRDGRKCCEIFEQDFDKVLCDVPCYTDRHILFDDETSLFQTQRARERLQMPEKQAGLLV